MTGDAVKVSVQVAVAPADAFEVFTREIDGWWRTGPQYRLAGREPGRLFLEEKAGGRLFESFGERTVEMGKVTVWEPPSRLSLEWRAVNFAPGEVTYVDVTFEPSGSGTLVVVRHHGWSALREGHPVRHGQTGAAFVSRMGQWWAGLLTSYRRRAAERG